jgi:uncharacterized protein YeaO (DUF488 family)
MQPVKIERLRQLNFWNGQMSSKAPKLRVKRVYEPHDAEDGTRILVDRLWPRGLSKASAGIDLWLKDIAPSKGLRDWFGHDPARWDEFVSRYRAELDENGEGLDELRSALKQGQATLLYAAHDEKHNNAVALLDYLAVK